MPIRVFLADDHELVRLALRTLIDGEPDMEVVGEAADTDGAVSGVMDTEPNVLVLDLRMPGAGGVEACRQIHASRPDTAVLVLTSFDADDDVFDALSAGACGYLLKDTRPEQLVSAIRSISDGNAVFESHVAARVISGRTQEEPRDNGSLSEREMEVLDLMAQGLSNREIGQRLWIGEATVKTHVSHILQKLGQADRTQAVLAAIRAGIIEIDH